MSFCFVFIWDVQLEKQFTSCGDRDKTGYHIITECSKLSQKKYKIWHDWMGVVMHWKLCKGLKFDHPDK